MNNSMEILVILDRSGSMESIREDTIGGFNAFIEDQKKLNCDIKVSLVTFSQSHHTVFNRVPISDVFPLSVETYTPGGCTALLDAVCSSIDELGNKLDSEEEQNKPNKVLVCIITDGQENSSVEFNLEDVKRRILHQEEKYNWQFLYIGANQDSFTEAKRFGISFARTANYNATGIGTKQLFRCMSEAASSYATTGKSVELQKDSDGFVKSSN